MSRWLIPYGWYLASCPNFMPRSSKTFRLFLLPEKLRGHAAGSLRPESTRTRGSLQRPTNCSNFQKTRILIPVLQSTGNYQRRSLDPFFEYCWHSFQQAGQRHQSQSDPEGSQLPCQEEDHLQAFRNWRKPCAVLEPEIWQVVCKTMPAGHSVYENLRGIV
jgi:hypothetical protein